MSLDKFIKYQCLSKNEIKRFVNIQTGFDNFVIVIFHPQDVEMLYSHKIFENILNVLKEKNINIKGVLFGNPAIRIK